MRRSSGSDMGLKATTHRKGQGTKPTIVQMPHAAGGPQSTQTHPEISPTCFTEAHTFPSPKH